MIMLRDAGLCKVECAASAVAGSSQSSLVPRRQSSSRWSGAADQPKSSQEMPHRPCRRSSLVLAQQQHHKSTTKELFLFQRTVVPLGEGSGRATLARSCSTASSASMPKLPVRSDDDHA